MNRSVILWSIVALVSGTVFIATSRSISSPPQETSKAPKPSNLVIEETFSKGLPRYNQVYVIHDTARKKTCYLASKDNEGLSISCLPDGEPTSCSLEEDPTYGGASGL